MKTISNLISPRIVVLMIFEEDSPKNPIDSLAHLNSYDIYFLVLHLYLYLLQLRKMQTRGSLYEVQPARPDFRHFDMNIIYLDHQRYLTRYQFQRCCYDPHH